MHKLKSNTTQIQLLLIQDYKKFNWYPGNSGVDRVLFHLTVVKDKKTFWTGHKIEVNLREQERAAANPSMLFSTSGEFCLLRFFFKSPK